MKSVVDRIIARWGAMAATPVTLAAIAAFEHRVAPLPPIMKALLSKANGMRPGAMDRDLMRFWSIEEWEEREGFVTFADWSISAQEYAWHTPTGNVSILGGDVPMIVARTIDDFLTYYLDDPKRMLG